MYSNNNVNKIYENQIATTLNQSHTQNKTRERERKKATRTLVRSHINHFARICVSVCCKNVRELCVKCQITNRSRLINANFNQNIFFSTQIYTIYFHLVGHKSLRCVHVFVYKLYRDWVQYFYTYLYRTTALEFTRMHIRVHIYQDCFLSWRNEFENLFLFFL